MVKRGRPIGTLVEAVMTSQIPTKIQSTSTNLTILTSHNLKKTFIVTQGITVQSRKPFIDRDRESERAEHRETEISSD